MLYYLLTCFSSQVSYSSFIVPISSSKLHQEVKAYNDVKHFETTYVVKMHQHKVLLCVCVCVCLSQCQCLCLCLCLCLWSEAQDCWTSTQTTYYYICVLILPIYLSSYYLYTCPHTTIYASSYSCIGSEIYVSAYRYMCPHTTFIFVLILPIYVSSYDYICFLILLYRY